MARCIFIVQGEGRGHMSQSIALREYLEDAGHSVVAVLAGCNYPRPLPGYYRDAFHENLDCFYSPYFLRTPNRKGIYVGRTILFNLARSLIYLSEIHRIRKQITALEPDIVFNFYDVIGALALRKIDPGIRRIGIGHHFFLHLEGYRCNHGPIWHRWLLQAHTKMIMKSCDRILALSFRETGGDGSIDVVPPLIRRAYRKMEYRRGDKYLVYLLNEGYIYDLIKISRNDAEFNADVFTDLSPEIELPSGLHLHPLSGEGFREKMASCRGLITTSGFDTVAEAAYLGIPLVVIPVRNHFEQRCNSLDVERSGIGNHTEEIAPGIQQRMKDFDNGPYRRWVDRAGEMIIKSISG